MLVLNNKNMWRDKENDKQRVLHYHGIFEG